MKNEKGKTMKQTRKKMTAKIQERVNDTSLIKLYEIIKTSFEKNSPNFEKLSIDEQLKLGSSYTKLIEQIQKNLTDNQSPKDSMDNLEINRLAEMIRSDPEALNLVNSLLDRIEEIRATLT
jgi:hypothetical protein